MAISSAKPEEGGLASGIVNTSYQVGSALGLAAIYRLSPEQLGPTQVTWTLVGLGCYVATLVLLRDYQTLSRYKYILGFIGVGLLLLPMTPLGKRLP